MKEYPSREGRFKLRLHYETQEIDDICIDALRQVDLLPSSPSPIKVDLFVEKLFDVRLLYEDLGKDIMGSTVFDSTGRVTGFTVAPWIEEDGSDISDRRVRSTIAHEGGHGLLHQKLFIADQTPSLFVTAPTPDQPLNFMCRSTDIRAENSQPKYAGHWWEWQANRAIGGLLLPRPLIRQAVQQFTEQTQYGYALKEHQRSSAEREVAELFEVNLTVARIRLSEIFPQEKQPGLHKRLAP